ncbi:antibiotic biosynthesis monooxygenase [Sulfitobacter sp. F26204]|uniref:antibiotic biosynthesis monooxygenase family protein n=1 Tax=Sulfitobacter sp. F26204 TaxID=2996014 RepID=UPI00225E4264|nr:antibiotic biosynthesis monooxygenase [Sulfitobacter sp. F26204]MCX7561454.1 antibiotic biosynthesis monooxygenase [Sulfitobacter sp. F26204]
MYLRIYWGKIEPASWDLIEQRYGSLMDLETKGLLGRFVTQDTNDPESLFTVTIWRSMQDLKEWEESPEYRDVFQKAVAPYLMGSHSVSLCEVKQHDIRGLIAQA